MEPGDSRNLQPLERLGVSRLATPLIEDQPDLAARGIFAAPGAVDRQVLVPGEGLEDLEGSETRRCLGWGADGLFRRAREPLRLPVLIRPEGSHVEGELPRRPGRDLRPRRLSPREGVAIRRDVREHDLSVAEHDHAPATRGASDDDPPRAPSAVHEPAELARSDHIEAPLDRGRAARPRRLRSRETAKRDGPCVAPCLQGGSEAARVTGELSHVERLLHDDVGDETSFARIRGIRRGDGDEPGSHEKGRLAELERQEQALEAWRAQVGDDQVPGRGERPPERVDGVDGTSARKPRVVQACRQKIEETLVDSADESPGLRVMGIGIDRE